MSCSPATVIETRPLNPRLRRVSLRVDDPESLAIAPDADAAVGVYFDAESPDEGRTYSVRHHDGDLIDLDVMLHPGGPGSTWAQSAEPGQRVRLDHARAWYRPPPDAAWQLLVSDLAGLAATARIMEEAPRTVSTIAVVEVADLHDLDYLPLRAGITLIPGLGSGNGFGPSRLMELVGEIGLVPNGYCWFAGEAGASRAVRKYLRRQGWTVDRYDIAGYWRSGSEAWDAKFAPLGDDLFAVYQRAIADGKGAKAAAEEFDDALERAGL